MVFLRSIAHDLGMRPTREHLDFYQCNGYLPWGRILDEAQLGILRQEYDRIFVVANGGRELAAPGRRMRQIMNVGGQSLPFRRLWHHEPILEVFRVCLGPQLQLWHDQALWKPAHDGGAVFWHQDNSYWKLSPALAMSCWMTLDDADTDNGAMQVIPGSHLAPVWHGEAQGTTALVDASAHIDTSQAVSVPLPAGSCMFHHCQTLHYTAPNRTARQRRAFIIHVVVPGVADVGGCSVKLGFDHPILSYATDSMASYRAVSGGEKRDDEVNKECL